jgi:hypothetical protein
VDDASELEEHGRRAMIEAEGSSLTYESVERGEIERREQTGLVGRETDDRKRRRRERERCMQQSSLELTVQSRRDWAFNRQTDFHIDFDLLGHRRSSTTAPLSRTPSQVDS